MEHLDLASLPAKSKEAVGKNETTAWAWGKKMHQTQLLLSCLTDKYTEGCRRSGLFPLMSVQMI